MIMMIIVEEVLPRKQVGNRVKYSTTAISGNHQAFIPKVTSTPLRCPHMLSMRFEGQAGASLCLVHPGVYASACTTPVFVRDANRTFQLTHGKKRETKDIVLPHKTTLGTKDDVQRLSQKTMR